MLRRFFQSFIHAGRGLARLVRGEFNAKVHLAATALVLGAGLVFDREPWQWGLLVIAMALVWVTEALNTALESLADQVTLERTPLLRDAKDLGAAAVLLASIFAVALGAIVFWDVLGNVLAGFFASGSD